MKKRIFCAFLAAAMLLCLIPLSALVGASGSHVLHDDTTVIKESIDRYADEAAMKAVWKTKNGGADGSAAVLSMETSAENTYAGNGKSGKLVYNTENAVDHIPIFWFDGSIRDLAGDGLALWVKSSQKLTLKMFTTYDWSHTVQSAEVEVPAGESIVKFPFAAMTKTDATEFHQVQFLIMDADTPTGTLYFDAVGCYTAPAPSGSHVLHDDTTVIKESIDRYADEAAMKAVWKTKNGGADGSAAVLSMETSAENTYAGNGKSGKLVYNTENAVDHIPIFWFDGSIRDLAGDGLALWVKSSQKLTLKMFTTYDWSHTVQSAEVEVPAGESIVKFPFAAMTKTDATEFHQVQFLIMDADTPTGTLYFDAVGCYFPDAGDEPEVMDPTKRTHAADTFIWDDMDYADIARAKQEWTTDNYNQNGEGCIGSLESDPENVYGGRGTSIKMTYDRTKSKWSAAAYVNWNDIGCHGDGLTFWLKSDRSGTIVVSCLDGDWKGLSKKNIPIIAGENIVTVPWSELKRADGSDAILTNIRQIVIGFDDTVTPATAKGTLWFDAFGFTGVTDGSFAQIELDPPESFPGLVDGKVLAGEDFNSFTGDDDMEFILGWGCTSTANVELVEGSDKTNALRYTFKNEIGKNSNMACYTAFKNIDLGGSLSFRAKADSVFYVRLSITIGEDEYMTVVKTSTTEKTYQIPFTAFRKVSDRSVGMDTASDHTHDITQMTFVTGAIVDPPSIHAALSGEWIVDDIRFLSSEKEIERPKAFDLTAEGVRLQSEAGRFPVLTTVSITRTALTAQDTAEWLAAMGKDAESIDRMVEIRAKDMDGKSIEPDGQVRLTFDLPQGVSADRVTVWQCFLDGSVEKCVCTLTDGKLMLDTYKLGSYAVVVNKAGAQTPDGDGSDPTPAPTTGVALPLSALATAVGTAAGAAMLRRRKRR